LVTLDNSLHKKELRALRLVHIMTSLLMFAICAVATPALAQRADSPGDLYERHCSKCHGPAGSQPTPPPDLTTRPFDFSKCSVSSAEPDAAWKMAVAHGGPAVGLSDDMPAFSKKLSSGEIAALVAYLRGLCVDQGWPNGNLNLSRPILTEKAFPEDEVVILPMVSHHKDEPSQMRLATVIEKRFGQRNNVELAVPFASVVSDTERQSGVGDVELAIKRVLFADRPGTRILSAGLELVFPTGSESRGLGEPGVRYEPFLAAGLVRGLTLVQGTFVVELARHDGTTEHKWEYNTYVGRDLSTHPRRWTIGVELNGENKELALTPQVRKGLVKTGALAAAVGVQFPITERAEQHTRVVGYLLWDYREPVWRRQSR
jgi:mono/diheme cytochrome c family protein